MNLFSRKLEYLDSVRNTCELPILRKDFIIDPYQIYETKANGGDCILLIVAALDVVQLKDFSQLAQELDLDFFIEVHSESELTEALSINPSLVGINNRDLTTLRWIKIYLLLSRKILRYYRGFRKWNKF